VVIKKVPLIRIEAASEDRAFTYQTHARQRVQVCHRGNEHLTLVGEGNESAIKKMVDGRS
jgi:hypothetical protein